MASGARKRSRRGERSAPQATTSAWGTARERVGTAAPEQEMICPTQKKESAVAARKKMAHSSGPAAVVTSCGRSQITQGCTIFIEKFFKVFSINSDHYRPSSARKPTRITNLATFAARGKNSCDPAQS
jgi:hypothetical protein